MAALQACHVPAVVVPALVQVSVTFGATFQPHHFSVSIGLDSASFPAGSLDLGSRPSGLIPPLVPVGQRQLQENKILMVSPKVLDAPWCWQPAKVGHFC